MEPFLAGILLSVVSFLASTLSRYLTRGDVIDDVARRLADAFAQRKPTTQPLENQLDEAVAEMTKSSRRVADILSSVQADVEKRRAEAANIRATIELLRQEQEANKSLADLTAKEADAVRELLAKEVQVLKRRSYLPDILINVGVGALFFVIGLVANQFLP
jgi:uncharacterized phage infection (PIP) family protein YhgE